MSAENPYQAPEPGTTGQFERDDPRRLRQIAETQRYVIFAALFYLAILPMSFVLRNVLGNAEWVGVVQLGCFALVVTFGAFSLYRFASVLRGPAAAVVYVIGFLVPCLGLILLLVLSNEATKELRAAGIKVGFFGANPETIGSEA